VSGKGLGVSCSADGTTASWSLDDGKTIMRFPGHTAIINDIDVDRRGHLVVTVGRDFVANVYVLDEGRLIRTVPLERRSPKAVLLLDERTVLVGDYWGYLVFAPLDGRRSRCVRVASNGISALARRPDGDVLACSYDGSLLLIDCAACEVIGALHAMKQHVERPAVVSGVESMSAAHLGLPADAGGGH
jgi:WD40 repeat protein